VTPATRLARPRWWPAGLAWALWTLSMLGIAASLWFDHLLRQAGRTDLVQPNAIGLAWLLALVGQGGRGRAGRLPGGADPDAGTARTGLRVGDEPVRAPGP
jgi:hypothetical protein